MPAVIAVERDYPNTYARFTSLGPLMDKLGNGGKGIGWNTRDEVKLLGELNGKVADGAARGRPRIDTAHRRGRGDPALAPETNGDVAVKAWARCPASPASTTRIWPRARGREDPLPRHPGAAAQDHLVADLVGIESEHVSATTPATPTCTS
jgi:nitrate reductase alpha subunit